MGVEINETGQENCVPEPQNTMTGEFIKDSFCGADCEQNTASNYNCPFYNRPQVGFIDTYWRNNYHANADAIISIGACQAGN